MLTKSEALSLKNDLTAFMYGAKLNPNLTSAAPQCALLAIMAEIVDTYTETRTPGDIWKEIPCDCVKCRIDRGEEC